MMAVSEPDNSIIIINWNTRDLLKNCIESIYEHTHQTTCEIIVVDNGSSDDSVAMLKKHFPEVIIMEAGENLGFSKANNRGISIARGRYITLLNSDTVLVNDAMDRMVAYMDNNSDVGLLGGKLLNSDMSLQPSCRELPGLWRSFLKIALPDSIKRCLCGYGKKNVSRFSYNSTKEVEAIAGALVMTPKKLMETVGPLDERYFFYTEDIDWSRRFHENGWKVVFLHTARVIHFGGASSKAAPVKYRLEMMKADLVYYSKHHTGSSFYLIYLNLILSHLLRAAGMRFYRLFFKKNGDFSKYFINREMACANWLMAHRFKRLPSTYRT